MLFEGDVAGPGEFLNDGATEGDQLGVHLQLRLGVGVSANPLAQKNDFFEYKNFNFAAQSSLVDDQKHIFGELVEILVEKYFLDRLQLEPEELEDLGTRLETQDDLTEQLKSEEMSLLQQLSFGVKKQTLEGEVLELSVEVLFGNRQGLSVSELHLGGLFGVVRELEETQNASGLGVQHLNLNLKPEGSWKD